MLLAEPGRRSKKQAFDKRHKSTVGRMVDEAYDAAQGPYNTLVNGLYKQINGLSMAEIALQWQLDPRLAKPLMDDLQLAMMRARTVGHAHHWDDLKSMGFDKWIRQQEAYNTQLPTSWSDPDSPAKFARDNWDDLPPQNEDALIKWFEAKTPHPRSTFDQLSQIDKTNAFTIAGTESVALVTKVKEIALEGMTEGISKAEFGRRVKKAFETMGVEPTTPWHRENVYRTTLHSAYNAARYMETYQLNDPAVDEFLPYLQYSTTGAANVCKICGPYDNLVYEKNDPAVQAIYPPNHYQCACAMVSVSVLDFEDEGLELAGRDYLNDPKVPQPLPGFDGPPAAVGSVVVKPRVPKADKIVSPKVVKPPAASVAAPLAELKTLKDVEQYLATSNRCPVKLRNLEPDVARDIAVGIDEFRAKFPDLRIDGIETYKKTVAGVATTAMVNRTSWGTGVIKNILRINTGYLGHGQSLAQVNARIKRSFDTNYWQCESVRGMVHHELGHNRTYHRLTPAQVAEDFTPGRASIYDGWGFIDTRTLSSYAGENHAETIAEAYALYMRTGSISGVKPLTPSTSISLTELIERISGDQLK